MADRTIDEATQDTNITGVEKIPMSDQQVAKFATTSQIKDYTVAQIEAIAAASGVTLADDKVYLLQSGAIKPISAQTLAGAVLDYGFGIPGIVTITGNEVMQIQDDGTKKTMTMTQLANYMASNVAIPWASLTEAAVTDLANDDYLVFRDTSADGDKKVRLVSYSAYVCAAFKAYVESLDPINTQQGESVGDGDMVYLVHTSGTGVTTARKATVAQLLAAADIGNPVIGPADPLASAATAATTENCIPQWDSTVRKLKNGVSLVLSTPGISVDTASDISVASTSSVKNYVDASISGIGAVTLTGDQTVAGVKTFSSSPIVPNVSAGSADGCVANKKYVDDNSLDASDFVAVTGNQTVDGIKTFNLSPRVPNPPSNPLDATPKSYVDGLIGGTDLAHLSGAETFTGTKTFSGSVIVQTPTASSHPATKAYADERETAAKTYADGKFVDLTSAQNNISGEKTFIVAPLVTATIPAGDNTTKVATTAFVQTALQNHHAVGIPRYPIVTKQFVSSGFVADDCSVNVASVNIGDTVTITMPTATSGYSRSFIIVLNVDGTGSGSVTVNLAGGTFVAETSTTFTLTPGVANVIGFTEDGAVSNRFLVSRRTFTNAGTAFTATI